MLYLDQEKYTRTILERFNMQNCHPVGSPANPDVKLSKSMSPETEDEKKQMQSTPYQEAVGCLMYLSHTTRPDIAYAVNSVSQYSSCYGPQHWTAVKRIFRYLKKTVDSKLVYHKNQGTTVEGSSDSDWAGDDDTRRSTTGYIFIFQSGPISWKSKRQRTVSLSSCEAELNAIVEATQEGMWLRKLHDEISSVREALPIKSDNQSAICLVKNGNSNARTKHVDIKFKFVTEKLYENIITLSYVNTKEQAADGLTKSLTPAKQEIHRELIGLRGSI